MMLSLLATTRPLRDLVNEARRHNRLYRGPRRDWNVLTSALDTIEDTAWALKTYVEEVETLPEDTPHAYIIIYGVLNGLTIQQDATYLLMESLGFPLEEVRAFRSAGAWAVPVPQLAQARRIRIASAGHPVEWGQHRGEPASTFIVQRSVSPAGFELVLRYHDGRTEFEGVSLPDLVVAQDGVLSDLIQRVTQALSDEDHAHQEKFSGESLQSVFAVADYHLAKIGLSVLGSESATMGLASIPYLRDELDTLESALAKRQEPFEEPLISLYKRARHCLTQVEAFLTTEREAFTTPPRFAWRPSRHASAAVRSEDHSGNLSLRSGDACRPSPAGRSLWPRRRSDRAPSQSSRR
jgi:hypothetical protein